MGDCVTTARFPRRLVFDPRTRSPEIARVTFRAPQSGPRSLWRSVLVLVVIAAAIATVFHPIVFGGYTIAHSNYAMADEPPYRAPVVAVTDPGAGGCQDEPWLVLIRRALAHGEVPLVNLANGLGAPLLESLQPGVLYVANPLLLLLDTTKPSFFDVFVLLHVFLYVSGLYVLTRLYARASAALPAAILVGLSGITLVHVNMVHFRAQVWLPWAAYALVRIARGDRGRAWFCLLVFAHVAMYTAGALQEAFVSSLLLVALFTIECACARVDAPGARRERMARTLRAALALASSSAIACVAFVPYVIARADGDFFTAAADTRSLASYSLRGLAHFLVPHASGFYPFPFTGREFELSISDFSTLGVFLCVAGAIAVFRDRELARHERVRFTLFASLVVLGLAKLGGLPLFDFLQYVPFLREILFLKYQAWIFHVTAIVLACGLESLARVDVRTRRRSALVAASLVGATTVAVLWAVWGHPVSGWWSALPEGVATSAVLNFSGALGGALVGCALVCAWPRGTLLLLVPLVTASALLTRKDGWPVRRAEYPDVVECAEDADPEGGALPVRVLSWCGPNMNLIPGFESLSVFDPVNNDRFRALMNREFAVDNPWFILHPIPGSAPLDRRRVEVLQLLGVGLVYGTEPAPEYEPPRTRGGGVRIERVLPRLWLLAPAEAAELERDVDAETRPARVHGLRRAIDAQPAIAEITQHTNGYEFRVSADFHGVLVAQQAYTRGWRFEGAIGRPYLDFFPAWDVELVRGRTYHVDYVPRGLAPALWIALGGVVLACVSFFALLRRI